MALIERWLSRIENAFATAAIAILLACTVAVCVDVVMRYVFNRPLVWVTEVTEYALVYITFLGIAWAVPRKGHVVVDVFVNLLPTRGQALCLLFNNLVALLIAAILTIWGTTTALDAFSRHLYRPTALAIPTWIVIAIIPIGCSVLTARFMVESVNSMIALVRGQALKTGTSEVAASGLE